MLHISGIKKRYGKSNILSGIDIDCGSGVCVGILGVNGSGKSTFFSVLTGNIKGDGGSFLYDGTDLLRDTKLRSKLLGFVPQTPPLIDELSAKDNLLLWYDKISYKKQLSDGVIKLLGVDEFLKVRVKNMSGGMKKRLSICCGAAHNPKILILDEPTAALDIPCKKTIAGYLDSFKKSGGIVLMSTHDIMDIDLCDKIYIFKDGKCVPYEYNGDISALLCEMT